MARTGVTEKQVHDAADALLRTGERPTIERVRALLGTGSPNTVMGFLDRWWAVLGARLDRQEEKLALPDAPPEVVAAASALWTAALAHAKALAAAELGRDRAQVEKQRNDLLEREVARHAQLEQTIKDAAQAHDAQAQAETRHRDVERLADQLAAQLEDLKSQRLSLSRERDQLGSRLSLAEQRLIDQAASAAAERLSLESQFRASEDRWLQELDRSRQDTAKLQARLGKAEDAAHSAAERSLRELDAARTTLRASERYLAASEAKTATLEREVLRLHERLAAAAPLPTVGAVRKPAPRRKLPDASRLDPKHRSASAKPKQSGPK